MIKSNLKQLLAQRGMTQVQLAQLSEIRQPTISALCVDSEKYRLKHVPVEVMDKICCVLDCQPGDLFTYIPETEETPQD